MIVKAFCQLCDTILCGATEGVRRLLALELQVRARFD